MDVIGGTLKAVRAFSPQSVSGSTEVDGAIIDRKGYESVSFGFVTGAISGAPTNVQLDYRVTESDAVDMTGEAVLVALTTAFNAADPSNNELEVSVDLSGAKRYIRFSVTPTFTAGTSPSILTAVVAALGGAKNLPAA